jgi:hypothetical protein
MTEIDLDHEIGAPGQEGRIGCLAQRFEGGGQIGGAVDIHVLKLATKQVACHRSPVTGQR